MTQVAGGLRGHLGFLLKDSAIYGLGAALNKAITLFTFPLLARHFPVQEFGTIDLLNTLVVLAVTLLVFGQDSAVARYFYERDDTAVRQQVVSQSLALQLGLLALLVPPLLLAAGPLAEVLGLGADGAAILRLMVLQLPFFVLINFSQGLLKWTLRRGPFLLISVGSTAATLAGILLAMAWGQLSVVGLFTVYLAVRAGFGLLGLWFVRMWLVRPQGFGQLRQMVPFAVPFGIICVAASLLPFVERSAVAELVGGHALGIFAAGAKVAMLIALVINAFETSWGPFALSIFRQPDADRTFRAVLLLATLGLCSATLLLTAIGDLVVVLLGSARYAGAGEVVFALTMGLVVQSLGGITEVGIVFAKRSYLKLYAYGLGLVVASTAIYLLGTRFGIVGVAWGSLAGHAAKTVFEARLAQQAHSIRWHYGPPLAVCGLTLATGLVHQWAFDSAVLLGVRWVPLAGLLVLLALVWWGLLGPADRQRLLLLRRR
jgi:O-antigen/teichoic acid export membrane protein